MKTYDYIVVGSGCTGAMAAQTVVETNASVLMIDVGKTNENYTSPLPDDSFTHLRKSDSDQYSYFIGKQLEGVAWGSVGKGEQITPPRKHILRDTESIIPIASTSFSPAESLGYGGLGIGWGVGCWTFSDTELEKAGLSPTAMRRAYNIVADRIGISATIDDARAYSISDVKPIQPSPHMDTNHTLIYEKYLTHKEAIVSSGFSMGRAPLAVITKNMNGRKKYAYRDMDFYSDDDKSAYRPWITVDQLRCKSNFTYIGNHLAVSFTEKKEYTTLTCVNLATNKHVSFRAKKLLLAPGVLGSARIVLRSMGDKNSRLPLLCNPYSYVPCIQPSMLGKSAEEKKLGFAQLSLFLDESRSQSEVAMASLYSYQSLMLFRLARQVPLGFAAARQLLQYLSSAIVILGIHQPDHQSPDKYVMLEPDSTSPTGDTLAINYRLSKQEITDRKRREKKYIRVMRKMNVFALKRIDPGMGASIHYAGTIPFSDEDTPLTLHKSGRLHGTQRVFVADGSGFTFLPAKGLTFSIMANAVTVAENAIKSE
ncbi:hypothetical protein EON76_01435 [bacterium]|nr:MAG: hypothetical protein EON76_01435 [bacterium]